MRNLKRLFFKALLGLVCCTPSGAVPMSGGPYSIVKHLMGSSGSAHSTSTDYSMGLSFGESVAGQQSIQSPWEVFSGYWAAGYGNGSVFRVLGIQILAAGRHIQYQNGMPVDIPYNATLAATLSDDLDTQSLPGHVSAVTLKDPAGAPSNAPAPVLLSYDPLSRVISIAPRTGWTANTLYDIMLTSQLRNLGGAPLDQSYHVYFLTLAAGQANLAYVFPNPWRPSGPQSGDGAGQSGSFTNGVTFTSLPPESVISIYTLSGGLVREIGHSDTTSTPGQERWDVRNSQGQPAASGVYLWRVSSSDSEGSGKLMIIR